MPSTAPSPATGSARPWPASTYLIAVLAVSVAFAVMAYLVASDVGPPPAGVTVALIVLGLGIPLVAWWRSGSESVLSAPQRVALGAIGCAWLLTMASGAIRGESLTPFTLLVPLLVAFALLKPPSRSSTDRAAVAYAWILVGVSGAALALEALGVLPSWYEIVAGQDADAVAASDVGAYWLGANQLLGLDGRWGGPFLHPNLAGPVGAFLLVLGAARTGGTRIGLMLAGAAMLLLTSSRTSWAAAACGLATLVAAWWLSRPGRMPRIARVVIVAGAAVAFVAIWVRLNPGLSGRTVVWPVFIDLGNSAPLLGVGQAGIDAAIASGQLFGWAHHAHNVLIDAYVRTGILGAVIVVTALGAALAAAGGAARRGRPLGLALTVMLLVTGLTETTFRWGVLTPTLAALVLAVLLSPSARAGEVRPRQPAPARGTDPVPAPAQPPAGG